MPNHPSTTQRDERSHKPTGPPPEHKVNFYAVTLRGDVEPSFVGFASSKGRAYEKAVARCGKPSNQRPLVEKIEVLRPMPWSRA